jgi:uncharacterized protein YfiM (DUF2279 family)
VTICVLALGLVAGCAGMTADPGAPAAPASWLEAGDARRPQPADPWLAQDKVRHFAMSFAATGFTYGGARTLLDADAAFVTAAVAALGLGFGKEIHDARQGRWFSFKDMVWNAAGVTLGLTLVYHVR